MAHSYAKPTVQPRLAYRHRFISKLLLLCHLSLLLSFVIVLHYRCFIRIILPFYPTAVARGTHYGGGLSSVGARLRWTRRVPSYNYYSTYRVTRVGPYNPRSTSATALPQAHRAAIDPGPERPVVCTFVCVSLAFGRTPRTCIALQRVEGLNLPLVKMIQEETPRGTGDALISMFNNEMQDTHVLLAKLQYF